MPSDYFRIREQLEHSDSTEQESTPVRSGTASATETLVKVSIVPNTHAKYSPRKCGDNRSPRQDPSSVDKLPTFACLRLWIRSIGTKTGSNRAQNAANILGDV